MSARVYKTFGGFPFPRKCLVISLWITVLILQSTGGVISQDNSDSKDVSADNTGSGISIYKINSTINMTPHHPHPLPSNTTTNATTHPLQIKLLSPRPVIFLDLDVEDNFLFNYTLRCDHPATVYVVFGKSVTEDVATTIAGNPVKISCMFGTLTDGPTGQPSPHDVSKGPGRKTSKGERSVGSNVMTNKTAQGHFDISGQFEMRFKSHRIGRSFFLMFATKVSGPGATPPPGYGGKTANRTASNSGHVGIGQKQGEGPEGTKPTRESGHAQKKRGAGKGGPAGDLPPNTVFKGLIIVMKLPSAMDEIFRVLLYVVIITATIGMGIKVELDVVKEVMKKPLGPCIGLFCQYICMPLIAYVVATTVPQPSAAISLGIFTCGIVPGGGASNFWCYLLGGDVTLSVTMTTISSVAALGLIPMWLFTLGDNFKDDTADIHVPYTKILETLAIVLLPVFAGMILKRWFPKITKIINKILKPFLIIIILFLLGVGIYTNFYIFSMIRPMQILAGCLLPYVGYVIGGGIALMTCRSWVHVKTIAIETGIQNTGIAFMIVFFSLKPPDNQLAVVAPAASAIMTPLPLLVVTIFYTLYNRYKRKQEEKDGVPLDTKDDATIQAKDAPHFRQLSVWDKIRGKRPEDQTADMEEMLNQEMVVGKGSSGC